MTTNSPNPVDGDVQALIADCQAEIAEIEKMLALRGAVPYLKSQLKRQQVALASLTAQPDDRIVDDGCYQRIGCVQVSDKLNCTWSLGTQFYTNPPAQILRPVEKPQSFYGVIQDGKSVMLSAYDGQWLNKTDVIEALRQQGYEVKS